MKQSFFIIAIIFCSVAMAVEYSGFYRNQFTSYNIKSPVMGDINKVRMRIESNHFIGEFDGLTFHGINSYWHKDAQFLINQAYAEFDCGAMNMTIGKQIVLWGCGLFWNPTDIFNELPTFDPKIDFTGVNAIRAEVATGDFSYIWGAFSPASTLDSSRFVLRNVLNIRNGDFGVSYLRNGKMNQQFVSLDYKGQLFGANWWIETARFMQSKHHTYVLGLHYTFNVGNGIYFGAEYFHDESGEKDCKQYNLSNLIFESKRTLAQDYIFGMINYAWSYIIYTNCVTMINLNDQSFIINPSISLSPLQNVEMIFGGYLPLGEDGTEYKPDFSDYSILLPNAIVDVIGKEMVYLWIEVNF